MELTNCLNYECPTNNKNICYGLSIDIMPQEANINMYC